MPHPHPHPSPSPSPHPRGTGALVEILAAHLVEAHRDGTVPGAALIRARPAGDGIDLAVWPLDAGQHPVEALAGTEVGPRWTVSGLITEAEVRTHGEAPGQPVALAVLADRTGRIAHRMAGAPNLEPLSDPAEGRLVDGVRRSLGLPTPPPTTAAGPWWATLWLDRIIAEVAAAPARRLTLVDLGAFHPLVGPGLSARDVTVLHRIAPSSSTAGWEVMRRAVASPIAATAAEHAIRQALLPFVTPALAHWFDQGSFARWLDQALPPRSVLLAATDALLAPRLARALRQAVGG